MDAVQRTAAAVYEHWFALDLLVEGGRCAGRRGAATPAAAPRSRSGPATCCSPPAAPASCSPSPPTRSRPPATASPWRCGPGWRWPTSSSCSSTRPRCTTRRCPGRCCPRRCGATAPCCATPTASASSTSCCRATRSSRAITAAHARAGHRPRVARRHRARALRRAVPDHRRRAGRGRARPGHRLAAGGAGRPLPVRRHRRRPRRGHVAARACGRRARRRATASTAPTGWRPTRCSTAWCSAPGWSRRSSAGHGRAPAHRGHAGRARRPRRARPAHRRRQRRARPAAAGAAPATASRPAAVPRHDDRRRPAARLQRAMTADAGVLRSAASLAGGRRLAGAMPGGGGRGPDATARPGDPVAVAADELRAWPTCAAVVGRRRSVPRRPRHRHEEPGGAHARTDFPDLRPASCRRAASSSSGLVRRVAPAARARRRADYATVAAYVSISAGGRRRPQWPAQVSIRPGLVSRDPFGRHENALVGRHPVDRARRVARPPGRRRAGRRRPDPDRQPRHRQGRQRRRQGRRPGAAAARAAARSSPSRSWW